MGLDRLEPCALNAAQTESVKPTAPPARPPFRHEALVYSSADELTDAIVAFVVEGLERDEPALVAVAADKLERLRAALPTTSDSRLELVDMGLAGANPAHIIPVWRSFLTRHVDAGHDRMRGVGEPITPDRSPDELVECQLHEALLNLAFAGDVGFTLLCPYDAALLPADVIAEARRTHHATVDGRTDAAGYDAEPWLDGPFTEPLVPAPDTPVLAFDEGMPLHRVRRHVAAVARLLGHDATAGRASLLVHEAVTNTLRHGGGSGSLQIWVDDGRLTCEVRDHGWIRDPLVGRVAPSGEGESGRGLWLVQQLSDLTQIRTGPDGTTVRIHLRRR